MDNKINSFLSHIKRYAAYATYKRKCHMITMFSYYCIHHKKPLEDIQKHDIEDYVLSHPHWCHETRYMYWYVIKELYDFLDIPDNPAASIRFRKHPRKTIKLPSQPVIEHAVENTGGSTSIFDLRNRLMVELSYGSGLRRIELTRLDIEDIDFYEKTVYVRGKGNKNRRVPITGKAIHAAVDYLKQRGEYQGPLFINHRTGRRLYPASIWFIFKKNTGLRTHIFRHACASHMLKNGCNIRIIQELLGHKNVLSTQYYTHITKEDLISVVSMYHPRSEKTELVHDENECSRQ